MSASAIELSYHCSVVFSNASETHFNLTRIPHRFLDHSTAFENPIDNWMWLMYNA